MKGSEILIRSLKNNRISKVYGILGREAAAIQFNELDEEVEFCLTHHENTAGIMACGVAQCTKLPQACFVTLGPGLTHIMTSVATARLDRLPVLFIAAQVERDGIYYNNAHQCIDSVAAATPFVKFSHQITTAEEIFNVISEAVDKMLTPPFGPALVSIPIDVLSEEGMFFPVITEEKKETNFNKKFVSARDVEIFSNALKEAKNPIIVIGDATYKYKTNDDNILLKFAEMHEIPILSTYAAVGFIPHNHKLNWGILNSYEKHFLKVKVWEEYFKEIDLILLVGYDPVEHHPRTWNYGKTKKIISVLPYELELNYINSYEVHNLVCDIDELLAEVNKRIPKVVFKPNYEIVNRIREKREEFLKRTDENKILINNIHEVLRRYLKNNLVVANDVGLNRHLSATSYEGDAPYCFLTSAGLSSFGTGLALGMGAKIAQQDKEVVVIAGDGGFLSSCYDLETVIRLGLKILVIVYNSSAYSLIERYLKSNGKNKNNPLVTQFNYVDFSGIATAMGCKSQKVDNIEDFEMAVKEFIENNSTYVIEIEAEYPELYL